MHQPLWLWQRNFDGSVIPPNVLKPILQMILTGLDYLHTECRVVHGGGLQIHVISSVANVSQTSSQATS